MKKLVLAVAIGLLLGVLGKLAWRQSEVAGPSATFLPPEPRSSEGGPSERAPDPPQVPNFVTTTQAERVPGRPGYDPMRFIGVMPANDLFDQEARDPVWAPAMEKGLSVMLRRDLARLQAARDVAVECRTTGCRFSWDPASDPKLKTMNFLIHLYGGAGAGGSRSKGELISFFKGGTLSHVDSSNPSVLLPELQKKRDQRLAVVRSRDAQGRPPLFPDIPIFEWPEE
jgi:hypothetical protein